MPEAAISRELLAGYEARHISTICTAVRFVDDNQNHCAHFVNHVLAFAEPLTCGQLLGRPGAAANIRVHETFAKCPLVGDFEQRPPVEPCFAFVIQRSAVNLTARTMLNVPKKHIGIFCDGEIWHYSNTDRRVVRQSPEQFAKHYSGEGFALFFGTFPASARALVAAAPTAPSAVTAPELKRGQSDDIDVAIWQQFLIIRKLLLGANVHSLLDGNFGPKTEEATEAFQVSAGLAASGVVDSETNRAAIAQGFIPRTGAVPRVALTQVTPAMTAKALAVLSELGPTSVFYTEQVMAENGERVLVRLEPHKHTEGAQLRYWHRGVTLYPFQERATGGGAPPASLGHAGIDT